MRLPGTLENARNMAMRRILVLMIGAAALLAGPARATTLVEVLGRVAGTSLNNGAWSGVRAGEVFNMTFEGVGNGTIVGGSTAGRGVRALARVPGSVPPTS